MPRDSQPVASRLVRFGDFELRLDDASLLHKGSKLKLQPQPFRVLAFLILKSPSIVTKEELGEHIWGDGVHVDLDQSLHYCIRQIRQALDDSATLPRYVETLPRQGYRFICPLGAVSEPPPEIPSVGPGEFQPADPPFGEEGRSGPGTPGRPALPDTAASAAGPATGSGLRRMWQPRTALAVGAFLALAALLMVASRLSLGHSPPRVQSLAVLPIQNLSGDPGQEYLSDGMTEELTTKLARDTTLRIVSRTSTMQYKGARRPLREIAQALGADAVMEGSLAREGTRMHVTLQLIRADTDSHLWAESYNRDANDATVSDEAARSVAQRLNSAAKSPSPTRYIAPAAHEAYLRGRYLWPTIRAEESGAYFRKATEIQPDYAEAWAGLSNFYGEGIAGGFLDPRINRRLEEESAERAMALAPDLAASHVAMSAVYLIDRWDWRSADREVLQAISLDPNDAVTLYLRANVLEAMGRFAEAIEVEKKSVEMDPFERPDALASIYVEARLFDEALSDIQLRMDTAPNDPMLLYTAADVWRRKRNYKEATESWAKWFVVMGDPQSAASLRHAYELGGARGFVQWHLKRRLMQAKTQYVAPVELASYYAQLGDKEHTLALLEEGLRQRATDILWVPDDPAYDFLHGDSRYQEIVRNVSLPPTR